MTSYSTNLTTLKGQADRREYDRIKRKFARHLSPPQPGLQNRQSQVTRRWATVASVNAAGTVSLVIDGQQLPTSTVCLKSYTPNVGDSVIVDFIGSDLVVIGVPGPTFSGVEVGGLVCNTTSGSGTGNVVSGCEYLIWARAIGTQHTANGIVVMSISTDDAVVNSLTIGEGLVTAGYQFSGAGQTLYVPTATRLTTFSYASSTSGGTFSTASSEISVTRVT